MFFVGFGSVTATIVFEVFLVTLTFVIAYRRNRRYFGRSVWGAIGIALAASLICPIGALLFYAVSSTGSRRRHKLPIGIALGGGRDLRADAVAR